METKLYPSVSEQNSNTQTCLVFQIIFYELNLNLVQFAGYVKFNIIYEILVKLISENHLHLQCNMVLSGNNGLLF